MNQGLWGLLLTFCLLGGALGCGRHSNQHFAENSGHQQVSVNDQIEVESVDLAQVNLEALFQLDHLSPSQIRLLEAALFKAINDYRVSKGLKRVNHDPRISEVAREHSRQMSDGSVEIGHVNLDRRFSKIKSFLPHKNAGEIVAYNYNVAHPLKIALSGWKESPAHHRLMLTRWEKGGEGRAGLGIARGKNRQYYFTQIFVTTR